MNKSTDSSSSKKGKENYFNCEVKTYEDSLNYVKKLIVVAISNIAYLRALFPEDLFTTRYFENHHIKIIRSVRPDTKIMCGWISGIFEAIEKKYLRCFSLSIYLDSAESENVIETYDFKISYNENVSLEMTTSKTQVQRLKQNSIRIIRAIMYACDALDDLPNQLHMNMRLFYYDDVTPPDYEPKGFTRCDFTQYHYEDGKASMSLGKTHSLWHTINLEINCSKTMLKQADNNPMEKLNVDDDDLNTDQTRKDKTLRINVESGDVKSQEKANTDEIINQLELVSQKAIPSSAESEKKLQSPILNKRDEQKPITKDSAKESLDKFSKLDVDVIGCVCGLNDDKVCKMLKCTNCSLVQHSICFGFLLPDDDYAEVWLKSHKHVCRACFIEINDMDRISFQDDVYLFDEKKANCLSITRRILYWLYKQGETHFSLKKLNSQLKIKMEKLNKALKEIEKESIVKCTDKKERLYTIESSKLNKFMKDIFIDPTLELKRKDSLTKRHEKKTHLNTSLDSKDISFMESETSKRFNDSLSSSENEIRQSQTTSATVIEPNAKKLKASICEKEISQKMEESRN